MILIKRWAITKDYWYWSIIYYSGGMVCEWIIPGTIEEK